ncbi:hypothetical protein PU629_21355 [Pullulanibacillus sp. KACC 23026]|uniref:hypothetical protein n=1 Tax=Pullulanibacillus sp. KACC 23026 TaxID=3028315 RepID=UPI0023B164F8|nr:hypothetical protein [Pullulanibacillus sp. KACC 23026]WEG12602.1 hypothetical protein PU629_21355 [Pullulanibacillus sp. KACC 23026]
MFKVGFVDDDSEAYKDYRKRLRRKDIDLHYLDNWRELNDIVEWILLNSIECLIVDHKLTAKYAFHGTKVVAYINSKLPDLPCLILTNYPEDSKDENLVVKNLILDRNIMSSDDISEICDIIKQAVFVFRNRLEIHLSEYETLFRKRESDIINSEDEETFLHLYKILKSYGEVDDISTELLKTEVHKKVDNLMAKLDRFIDINRE